MKASQSLNSFGEGQGLSSRRPAKPLLQRILTALQPFKERPKPPGLWIYPDWLAADEAERRDRAKHKAVRAHQQAKREALHRALAGGGR